MKIENLTLTIDGVENKTSDLLIACVASIPNNGVTVPEMDVISTVVNNIKESSDKEYADSDNGFIELTDEEFTFVHRKLNSVTFKEVNLNIVELSKKIGKILQDNN